MAGLLLRASDDSQQRSRGWRGKGGQLATFYSHYYVWALFGDHDHIWILGELHDYVQTGKHETIWAEGRHGTRDQQLDWCHQNGQVRKKLKYHVYFYRGTFIAVPPTAFTLLQCTMYLHESWSLDTFQMSYVSIVFSFNKVLLQKEELEQKHLHLLQVNVIYCDIFRIFSHSWLNKVVESEKTAKWQYTKHCEDLTIEIKKLREEVNI